MSIRNAQVPLSPAVNSSSKAEIILFKSLSLKWKAVLGVSVLTITVLVLSNVMQMHSMHQDLVRLVSEQLFSAARGLAGDLEGRLETFEDITGRLGNSVSLDALQSPASAREYLRVRPNLLATFDDVMIVLADGQVLADLSESPNQDVPPELQRADFARLT